MYQKDFNSWNEAKKKIESSNLSAPIYIREREVWWTSVGLNVGVEIDGKNELFERPVLVFRKLNATQFYGLPLTSKDKVGDFYRLVHYGKGSGMVCLSQLRVFSIKRVFRKIDTISKKEFKEIKNVMINFFMGERF